MHFDTGTWVAPYGLLFLVAIGATWCLARRNAISINIDGSHVDLLMPLTVVFGVAGAILLSVVMPADRLIAGEAMQAGFRVRLFGFLGSAAALLFVYSRVARLPYRRLLDVFALPTIAGLMIHRLGCFVAGCCWGDLVSAEPVAQLVDQVQTLPFLAGLVEGVQYPQGSLAHEQHVALGLLPAAAMEALPVYPVQLYESAALLVLLLLFSRIAWRRRPDGWFALAVVCSYAAIRFLLEFLRADGAIVLANLTLTQLQCLFLLAFVVLLPDASRHRHPRPD